MKNRLTAILIPGLLLISLSGCSPNHAVVLVPGPDGTTGNAEVSTAAGKQRLEKASDMTEISNPATPPSPVKTASAEYIATTFGEALAVEPAQPEKFILFFEQGTATLNKESRDTIAAITAACKRRAATSVTISGHTDAVGSPQLNEKLSQGRSERIRRLLQQNGIKPELMSVSSHGKRNPLVATPDGVAEPRNRRVEVIVR